jgi:hypothetical protein
MNKYQDSFARRLEVLTSGDAVFSVWFHCLAFSVKIGVEREKLVN